MYRISIEAEEIEKMPLGCFPGEIQVIDKKGLPYYRAIEYMARQKILGFDTESRPCFSPHQHNGGVALLQLSGPDKAFLFRVQSLGMPSLLCKILSSKRIVKVGAAVTDDVRGLQRYAKFKGNNFVDLQRIGCEWGIRDKSVKKMAAIIMGVKISKSQQLSNWEAEKLSEPQKKYASTDAWICREMYLRLLSSEKHPLSEEEKIPPQQLQQMQEARARRSERAEVVREENNRRHEAAAAARRRRAERNLAAQQAAHEAALANPKHRHRHKRKKKPSDGKNNTEKEQG